MVYVRDGTIFTSVWSQLSINTTGIPLSPQSLPHQLEIVPRAVQSSSGVLIFGCRCLSPDQIHHSWKWVGPLSAKQHISAKLSKPWPVTRHQSVFCSSHRNSYKNNTPFIMNFWKVQLDFLIQYFSKKNWPATLFIGNNHTSPLPSAALFHFTLLK